ncbi:hypothetical protein NBRC116594_28370 [Shimia sp. NS0008-38b]|uniref:hypothetical protein n=1 Tax=Shimia sp. NS0008-38b TaxID=3127653 RepID=UPI00310BF779
MGPLVLLSLLGIGAATAIVDIMGNSDGDDGSSSSDSDANPDQNRDDLDGEETQDGPSDPQGQTNYGTDGDDDLFARGAENIDAKDGNDRLFSRGSGILLGGDGDDAFALGGSTEGFGEEGDDYMHISDAAAGFGGEGNDTFFLKPSQSTTDGPATADGGEGDDTFLLHPLDGLPENTVAHILTGGAGADVYALDIDSAISVRPADADDNQIIATITDFDPDEDLLLVDLGAAANFQDVDELPLPDITTTEDPDGAYTDVHFSWTNPLNPDNVEMRTMRLEGVTDFSAGEVQLTSVFDPDSQHFDDATNGHAEHRLYALTPTDGSADDDTLALDESAATTLKDGDDTLTLTGGTHLAYGGEGDDTMTVATDETGAAQLFGGEGDDVITADLVQDNDTSLFGGDGDDTITFGLGHYVEGNAGTDTLTLNVHANALNQGPAVLDELTGNHLTINVSPDVQGDLQIVNHTYGNGFEVAYSEIFIGDVPILKLLEEDFTNGVGIAEIDSRITIMRDAVL